MAETINEQIISRVYNDPATGITIVEDTLGRFHLLSQSPLNAEEIGTPIYLDAIITTTWPDVTQFHTISGMIYTVPSGMIFIIDFISAASNKDGMNIIGIYIDDVEQNILPFTKDLNFNMQISPNYSAGTEIELRFKPPTKYTDLTICLGGRTRNV